MNRQVSVPCAYDWRFWNYDCQGVQEFRQPVAGRTGISIYCAYLPEALNPSADVQEAPADSSSRKTFSKVQRHASAYAQVALVVVDAVVECGHEIVGFDKADGEAAAGVQVEASAEVRGKGRAGAGGRGAVRPGDSTSVCSVVGAQLIRGFFKLHDEAGSASARISQRG
jgi:hypothetical protein